VARSYRIKQRVRQNAHPFASDRCDTQAGHGCERLSRNTLGSGKRDFFAINNADKRDRRVQRAGEDTSDTSERRLVSRMKERMLMQRSQTLWVNGRQMIQGHPRLYPLLTHQG
jgi:hypothetical protein